MPFFVQPKTCNVHPYSITKLQPSKIIIDQHWATRHLKSAFPFLDRFKFNLATSWGNYCEILNFLVVVSSQLPEHINFKVPSEQYRLPSLDPTSPRSSFIADDTLRWGLIVFRYICFLAEREKWKKKLRRTDLSILSMAANILRTFIFYLVKGICISRLYICLIFSSIWIL